MEPPAWQPPVAVGPGKSGSRFFPTWPRSTGAWWAWLVATATGIAIWIPAMATHPRYSRSDEGSSWYFVAMFVAAFVLAVLLARNWQLIAIGLIVPQFLMAPWTTPRGDNDGLWGLIFPILAVFLVVLHLVAGLSGSTVNALRKWVAQRAVT